MTSSDGKHDISTVARFRRWFVVLFISLYVFTGIVHSGQHFEVFAKSAVTEVSSGNSGDLPGDGASAAAEHCHGCATASLPSIETAARQVVAAGPAVMPVAAPLVGSLRPSDPPPPKALT